MGTRSISAFAVALLILGCGSKKAPPEDAPRDAGPPSRDAAVAPVVPVKPPRVEHAVFSLVDNRHAAHRYVDDEVVIDASGVSLARYTRFGVPESRWHLGQTIAGVRAATLDRNAMLELPLDQKLAGKITTLVARVHGKAGHRLAVRINGSKSKHDQVTLADGWQTVTLVTDPGTLRIGENQIGFASSYRAPKGERDRDDGSQKRRGRDSLPDPGSIAVEWLRFGTGGTEDLRGHAAFDARAGSIALAKNAMLLWYVTVPEGAHFVATVDGAGCKLEVGARAGDDTFVSGVLAAGQSRLDLTKLAGRVVGLTLVARDCAKATIGARRSRSTARPRRRYHAPRRRTTSSCG
ncbi:MAG: hypothetical protein WKG01_26495 [Kofleriaceae bacterium]